LVIVHHFFRIFSKFNIAKLKTVYSSTNLQYFTYSLFNYQLCYAGIFADFMYFLKADNTRFGESPSNGSSSINNFDFGIRALHNVSICFSPPLNLPAF